MKSRLGLSDTTTMLALMLVSMWGIGMNVVFSFQVSQSVTRYGNHIRSTRLGMSELTKEEVGNNVRDNSNNFIGSVAFLIPEDADRVKSKYGSKSPVENPTILEAVEHMSKKIQWFSDEAIETFVVTAPIDENDVSVMNLLKNVDALIAFNLQLDSDVKFLNNILETRNDENNYDELQFSRQCHFSFDCAKRPLLQLPNRVSIYQSEAPSISSQVLPWTKAASAKRMEEQMTGLFERWTSDEFTVALMLFFNQFSGHEIDWVKHSIDATWEKGPIQNAQELYSMVDKCGDCIVKCVQDEECKKCLDALTAVDSRDQVSSYTTLVSYESKLLTDFSCCILQKNNIFNCDAKIPIVPKVAPITSWRGKALTRDDAQQILIAHLADEDAPEGGLQSQVSWIVAAGANVAYDQFPAQNQIFYKSANGRGMWYDPVFRVETIDGRSVWCKRHYKVRDGKVPGTFHLSVLDNGVTSNEFWTIVSVADDLSWIIFHYAGAAGAVGQRYLGGLLCTADGLLPPESERDEIWKALKSAGIEPWELYVVDNRKDTPGAIGAGEPPLEFYREKVLSSKRKKAAAAEILIE
eukprot:CAMPEP_0197841776 /NCGR_PEP_ID=MMETSP1437-20131217/46367_1 /TAXON_ID=49252 ORGANISM="Eucampia antarctica, Strain CCMP1452" /NCGR_SAMPLE_ID=MMETSP1437 /ASSEMBLY_ACC=CAM_ASM_001096 /LENGTH=578 /DNA_ID=CAMNT_0043451577 /DNA_START=108 /DNA_END=1844 /DNA_ORIENTATION=+